MGLENKSKHGQKINSGRFKRSLVYGVGIDDVLGSKEWIEDGKRFSEKYYSTWKNMLKRCYHKSGEYLGKVSVHPDWYKLSNFKSWFDENYSEGFVLDKDLYGGKLYSPNHCIFIKPQLNKFLIGCNNTCGSHFDKSRGLYQSYTKSLSGKRINIGRFKTENEAVVYAKTVKMIQLNRLLKLVDGNPKLKIGLIEMMDRIYFEIIMTRLKDVGNCTFLDTGGVFKGEGLPYDLSIVKLSDYV